MFGKGLGAPRKRLASGDSDSVKWWKSFDLGLQMESGTRSIEHLRIQDIDAMTNKPFC